MCQRMFFMWDLHSVLLDILIFIQIIFNWFSLSIVFHHGSSLLVFVIFRCLILRSISTPYILCLSSWILIFIQWFSQHRLFIYLWRYIFCIITLIANAVWVCCFKFWQVLGDKYLQYFMYQMMKGLAYMHACNVLRMLWQCFTYLVSCFEQFFYVVRFLFCRSRYEADEYSCQEELWSENLWFGFGAGWSWYY